MLSILSSELSKEVSPTIVSAATVVVSSYLHLRDLVASISGCNGG